MADAKLLANLGLCKKAGALITGTELVCEALRGRKKPSLVVIAGGASDATRKKLSDKTAYYSVEAVEIDVSPVELAHAVGKTGNVAAAAVTDEGFAALIKKTNSQL